MGLRLRLTVGFASVTTIAIVLLSIVVYAEYGNLLYRDLDRSLYAIASSFESLVETNAVPRRYSAIASPDLDTLVQQYDADGRPIGGASRSPAPPLDARSVLERNDGPAGDALLRRLPDAALDVPGRFATVTDQTNGRRIRLYAAPVVRDGATIGYVETWSSLSNEDRTIARLRGLLLFLGGGVVVAVWFGGMSAAAIALRPLRAIISSAREIASSGDLGRRVPEAARNDEVGELTSTLNQMFDALQATHESQQRFIADTAHELRAPLAAISGNSELLSREPAYSTVAREANRQLRSAVTRMTRVIEHLLQLARSEAGVALTMSNVEVHSVVLEAAAEAGVLAPARRIEITELQRAVVRGDRHALQQVMIIALDNAIRHGCGTVRVGQSIADNHAIITVQDGGPGLPPEEITHIFDRFYRGIRAREKDPTGSGLGLAVAKTLVETHGGTLSAFSPPSGGFVVRCSLPLAIETLGDPD